MLTRIIVGVLTAALIIAAFFLGEPYLLVLIGGIGVIATSELMSSLRKYGLKPLDAVAYAYAVCYVPAYYFLGTKALFAITAVTVILTFTIFLVGKYHLFDAISTLTIIIYPFALMAIILISISPESALGKTAFALGIASSSFADVFAFAFGRALGKHKLCPGISPHKTYEGAIAGLIGGIAGALLIFVAQGIWSAEYSLTTYILLGFILGAIGQIGDLAASAIKRSLNVKDFGGLLPGHGGILDRVDSALFSVPCAYILLSLWVDWSKF